MTRKKNLRRLNVLVTAQTLHNLERLSEMEGDRNIGRAIDKLTREKMIALHDAAVYRGREWRECGDCAHQNRGKHAGGNGSQRCYSC